MNISTLRDLNKTEIYQEKEENLLLLIYTAYVVFLFIYLFILAALGFELRASLLLRRCSYCLSCSTSPFFVILFFLT
jgi:hypothetical protein